MSSVYEFDKKNKAVTIGWLPTGRTEKETSLAKTLSKIMRSKGKG